MQWCDAGILIACRPFGEADAVASFLTREHGLAKGLLKGGVSRKFKPFLQIGNSFNLVWKSRLEASLGSFSFDPIRTLGAKLYGSPLKLSILTSACALLYDSLAENQAESEVFGITEELIESLTSPCDTLSPRAGGVKEIQTYISWERSLLAALGFVLSLDKCNATGTTEDLCYISPKTGHAVCRSAGEPFKNLLLPLPLSFRGLTTESNGADAASALSVLEYFFKKRIYNETRKAYPFVRQTLAQFIEEEPLQLAA